MKNVPLQSESKLQLLRAFFMGFIQRVPLDLPLLLSLLSLAFLGLFILLSADNQQQGLLFRQTLRLLIAFSVMLLFAYIPPTKWRKWALGIYITGVVLLFAVMVMGVVGKGAQRWLDLGIIRFQPSEIMKLAIPMFLASYLNEKKLQPDFKTLTLCALIILIPVIMTAKQPDLGTAIMLTCSGGFVLLLAGISWRLVGGVVLAALAGAPILWLFMHNYQKERVLTFLDPERDPLGSGYHIIQSKIAIGSGGLFGKGWLNGTQSQLNFLPEHATDFIFAVFGEEYGFLGGLILLCLYLCIVGRGLYISMQAQDTFGRLLAGSLTLTFFFLMFINMGMVVGILPVVGIPLPLVSYGGTSMVTMMASFGLLMSIHKHRQLVTR